MSGNGGHPSSLQAATSGAPPFDPGPRDSPKHMVIRSRSSPSQVQVQNNQDGEFYNNSNSSRIPFESETQPKFQSWINPSTPVNKSQENDVSQGMANSWDADDISIEAETEETSEDFASAVKGVFPMGISNANKRDQASITNDNSEVSLVTPQVMRQGTSSTRGGRGGARRQANLLVILEGMQQDNDVEIIGHSKGTIQQGNDFRRANSLIEQESE